MTIRSTNNKSKNNSEVAMKKIKSLPDNVLSYLSKRIAIVRIVFGVVWVIDAAFKFEPAFYNGILQTVKGADAGEPNWLNPWFHLWYRLIGVNPHLFAIVIILAESLTALALLLGVARRLNYVLGAILSILIFAVAEGFGGPYVTGTTDIGAGFIYVIVFGLLFCVDGAVPPSWSLDPIIQKHISWWHKISDPDPKKIT
jgi:thiosulfate dehydrogenase [quinone] large subunit